MDKPRLLVQAGTGRQFIWTASLADRPDMTELMTPEPEPVIAQEPEPALVLKKPMRMKREA
jgi:hypothetical protein